GVVGKLGAEATTLRWSSCMGERWRVAQHTIDPAALEHLCRLKLPVKERVFFGTSSRFLDSVVTRLLKALVPPYPSVMGSGQALPSTWPLGQEERRAPDVGK